MSQSTCTLTAARASCQPGRAPAPVSAAVVGGSGYTGLVLAELLLRHPSIRLAAMTSERLAGSPVGLHAPRLRTDLRFTSADSLRAVDARLRLPASR